MDITRGSIPKSDLTFFVAEDRKALYNSAKTRLGADCGSDHDLPIAKFRLKLKAGKAHSGMM